MEEAELQEKLKQRLVEYCGPNAPDEGSEVILEYFGSSDSVHSDDGDSSKDDFDEEEMDNENEKMNDTEIPEKDIFRNIESSTEMEKDDLYFNDDKILEEGCGCASDCFKLFDRKDIIDSRFGTQDFDFNCNTYENHQQILLLGAFNALTRTGSKTFQKAHARKTRTESHTVYLFRGIPVCRKFFQYVYGCGEKRLKNVKKNLLKHGIEQMKHKSGQNINLARAFTLEERLDAVNFIKKFSEQNALVLPGRLSTFRLNSDLQILPCSLKKNLVYDLYEKAATAANKNPVGRTTWYELWSEFCPNIVIRKPRRDLCNVCQQMVVSLGKMQGTSEDVKRNRLTEFLCHLNLVHVERVYYKKIISQCADDINTKTPELKLGKHEPCSFNGKMHYSFDFVQQIHLPYNSEQVGPLFFLAGYKVALFGVACEPLKQFILYVIPEACAVDKSCNTVISLIDHFFHNFGVGETDVVCHADNCCSQNKNNYLMQYAVWRTMTGRHNSFQLSFLPKGHTKFAPDIYFGLLKKSFRQIDLNSLLDICTAAVNSCLETNRVTTVLVGNESGDVLIQSYDWNSFFKKMNPKTVPNLLSHNHFLTKKEEPGKISFKVDVESQEILSVQVFLSKCADHFTDARPLKIKPTGLSLARKNYLFEKIRPFVSEKAKDTLCPKPLAESGAEPEPEPVPVAVILESPEEQPLAKEKKNTRKRHCCSYCNEIGHRNIKRGSNIICPKRRADEG